ncbi:MAG: hypothetical protein BWY44_01457 [Candidatus Omnitrophica bacterium ADurb.Bin292]|nr:MAG: hypothetical protein BWY44_01457 [Candidatus Omnitrophica bacterium ADurb.Bin292]
MNYYFLKIGGSNCLAKQWLEGGNPLRNPAVVVFFGHAYYDEKDVLRGGTDNKKSLKKFFEICSNLSTARLVVIAEKLWILKPIGKVNFESLERIEDQSLKDWYGSEIKKRQSKKETFEEACVNFREGETPKYCQVEVENEYGLAEVPHILASMSGANNFNRQTICEIERSKHFGNYNALQFLMSGADKPVPVETDDVFKCLSPDELETLVAKIFEAYGCHVPAYSGKNMARVDLFAKTKNLGDAKIEMPGIVGNTKISLASGSSIGIQVKAKTLNAEDIEPISRPPVDYVVHLGNSWLPKDEGRPRAVLGHDWVWTLLNQKERCSSVMEWLKRSLCWIEFDKNF